MTVAATDQGVLYEVVRDPADYTAAYNALMREPTNRLRIKAVVELLHHVSGPVHRVLDVASGGGAYTSPIASKLGIAESAFVPVDRQYACVAGYRLNHPDAAPALANVTALPFRRGAFDLALCLDIIEHLDDDVSFLRDVTETIRPGGWVMVSTHNSTSIEHLVGLTSCAIRGTTWRGWDATHIRFYNSNSLRAVAEAAGLEVVALNGTYYVPFHFPARLISLPFERLGLRAFSRGLYQAIAAVGRLVNAPFESWSRSRLLAGLGFGIIMLARKQPDA